MCTKKDILFIFNPKSGNKKNDDIVNIINQNIDQNHFTYQITYTQYSGHAVKIASEAVQKGINIVVAIGGDGTVNEVARSLIHTSTILGIIPCGSGNGLARHLHIPIETKHAIELINRCESHLIDYGTINEHPFFCTCGIGFDAYISHLFKDSTKRGLKGYIEHIIKQAFKYKPEKYTIEYKNTQSTLQAFCITCANTQQYGNNAFIAPQASIFDGMLDTTIIESLGILDAVTIAAQLFTKTINKNHQTKSFRSQRLHIQRESSGLAHYDGEPIMLGKDLLIETVPLGIEVIFENKNHTY